MSGLFTLLVFHQDCGGLTRLFGVMSQAQSIGRQRASTLVHLQVSALGTHPGAEKEEEV